MNALSSRIVSLFLAAALASSVAAQQDARQRAVQHTVLDNGLQVLVVENHAVALATALVAVRNGAFTQEPREAGLAHLYEHVIFRAFKNSPSAFAQEVAAINGTYNGSTAEEVATYYVIAPSENVDKAMSLLGELLPRARFVSIDLEEERPVVLDELAREQSDPERVLYRRVGQELWGDAWHRRDVIGDSASLANITLDRVKETFERYYVPNNSALVVTGDVSSAEVLAAAERYFGEWPRGPDPFSGSTAAPFEPLSGHRLVALPESVQDFSIVVEFLGPSVRTDTADTYAADALVAVLNEPTSRFQQRLVASGMFQYLDARYRTLNDVGHITFSGKTTPERARGAVDALIAALDQPTVLLAISDEDLAIGRKRQALGSALALEQTATLAPNLGYWWATAGIDYYLSYHERLNQQTRNDLRRFAERYLMKQPRAIGLLGPSYTVERVATWLQRIAPAAP